MLLYKLFSKFSRTMPKGTILTDEERGKIDILKEEGYSLREIARRIGRSRDAVTNYIRLGSKYATKKRPGRPSYLTDRDKRRMIHLAVNSKLSSAKIKANMNISVTSRRIRQVLSSEENLSYRKTVPVPRLLPRHKNARLRFAEKHRFWDDEWSTVVFSDEKKFNLDGPDGSGNCWQDKRKKKPTRESRNFGGGTVMVWAGISQAAKTPICFISTKMNSEMYCELLEEVLIPFTEEFMDENVIFQQDNASCHAAKNTKNFLKAHNIPVMDWPACSPDLNPIENAWGILSQAVFAQGRTYENAKQLRKAIIDEWAKITPNILKSLITSMPRRLEEVIMKKGEATHY